MEFILPEMVQSFYPKRMLKSDIREPDHTQYICKKKNYYKIN